MNTNISLDVFNGNEASVNAYLFTDNESAILVDCLRNSEEAQTLAAFIKSKGRPLTDVLITHGHPDHYIGMDVIKHEFPHAQIVVTKKGIKDDIIAFSNWMESVGWLEKEASMKPKTENNPIGFDYENNIEILHTNKLTLSGGCVLELNSDYSGAECEHLTTIYNRDLNAFLTGDFCYNGVHLWLAINKENIANWKNQLVRFKEQLLPIRPKVYPGHGPVADILLFDQVRKYIEDFEMAITTSKTRAEAIEKMKALYPDNLQADFLLLHSINASIPE